MRSSGCADALLLAVHWSRRDDVLKQTGDLSGKVIVTCSLPMNADDTGLVIAHTPRARRSLPRRSHKRGSCRLLALCRAKRSEERRVGKECRYRWSTDH